VYHIPATVVGARHLSICHRANILRHRTCAMVKRKNAAMDQCRGNGCHLAGTSGVYLNRFVARADRHRESAWAL